jgi:hypothetical protein
MRAHMQSDRERRERNEEIVKEVDRVNERAKFRTDCRL